MRLPLAPPVGINSDETTYSTPGLWADGNNVRPYKGGMEAIGGWSKWHSVAVTGMCRNAVSWADENGQERIAFGTHNRLQVLVDGVLHDITPIDLIEGNIDTIDRPGFGDGYFGGGTFGGGELSEVWPRTWSLSTFGDWLIASPRLKGIYIWQGDVTARAVALSGAPVSALASGVTPSRQVLAFGCEEEISGNFNAMCIRGSDVEDIFTWNATTGNNAFEYILEGPGTRIISHRLFQERELVWTEGGLWIGTFQDLSEAPWRFDLVASDCGLSSPNAVTVTDQGAYWKTPDSRFFFYQYGAPPIEIPCMIRHDMVSHLDEEDKVVCTSNPVQSEVWWFYPDTRDGDECSRYVAFSTIENAWFRGQIARSAAVYRPGGEPLRVAPDGFVHRHEAGDTADGEPLLWEAQTSSFYIDEGGRRVRLSSIIPDFKRQGNDVTVTFYTQDRPHSTPREKGPYTLTPWREKRDIRVEGGIVSVKFSGTGSWRLGKPVFEYGLSGRR